jgi:hypothetical protein
MALRLRAFGAAVRVTGLDAIDAGKARFTFAAASSTDAGLWGELLGRAGFSSTYACVPGALGASCVALRPMQFELQASSAHLVVTRCDRASLDLNVPEEMPEGGHLVRVALFAPVCELRLRDKPMRMDRGACVGPACAEMRPDTAALCVDGGILVRNHVQFADSYASDKDMRWSFSSNVMSLAFAPARVQHEAAPRTMLPFLTMSTSNLHLRSPLVVEDQVTAKHVRTTSDRRLKRNVRPSRPDEDLDMLMRIPICRFEFIPSSSVRNPTPLESLGSLDSPERAKKMKAGKFSDYQEHERDREEECDSHVGVIAQEVAKVLPSAVGSADGFIAVSPALQRMHWTVVETSVDNKDNQAVLEFYHQSEPPHGTQSEPPHGTQSEPLTELQPGDTLKWTADDGLSEGIFTLSATSPLITTAGLQRVSVVSHSALPSLGQRIRLEAKRGSLKVIDTTELLCLTMSALQTVRGQLATLQKKVDLLTQKNAKNIDENIPENSLPYPSYTCPLSEI